MSRSSVATAITALLKARLNSLGSIGIPLMLKEADEGSVDPIYCCFELDSMYSIDDSFELIPGSFQVSV